MRKSSIELLRILSMLLITMHHYSVHGGFNTTQDTLSFNKILVQFLASGGKLGVDCFVLITGYFMINSSFKTNKILKLYFQILFYSIIIYILFYYFGYTNFGIKAVLKNIFPIIFGKYWFATTYVLLYLISPFLNFLLRNLQKSLYINLIFLLFFVWSFLPTFTTAQPGFSPLGWFITLYILAAYIRLYPNCYFGSLKINTLLFTISFLSVLLSIVILDVIGLKFHFIASHATHFIGMNTIPILISSISLFLIFKNLQIDYNRTINIIASTMFGVYLIHDNPYVRSFIWHNLFHNSSYYNSPWLFAHCALAIISVFISCIIIDWIRILLVEVPLLKVVEKLSNLLNEKWNVLNDKIIRLTNGCT